jgi:hypothetical protein
MKKVFFGILLAMAGLVSILAVPVQILLMNYIPSAHLVSAAFTLVMYLATALGYWLLMSGAESLPQTQFWYYAGTFSKYLCAYNVAMGLLDFVGAVAIFTLNLPSVVSQILYYITDLGSFFIMYFCVLGLRDLQYIARKNLYAVQVQKCFTAWMVIRLLGSLLTGWLYLVAVVAYIVMLFFYGKGAWAYDKRNPYQEY